MPFWRREEPLHEKLAREGGLPFGGERPPHDTRPRWGEAGIHGVHRPREWDVVVNADAPELRGKSVDFVVLADGTLVVAQGVDADALEPLAEALDGQLQAPYRAHAVSQGEGRWVAGARLIEVIDLVDEQVEGDEIELALRGGDRSLLVDGRPAFGSLRPLERFGEERGEEYVVRARRLEGDLFEIEAAPL